MMTRFIKVSGINPVKDMERESVNLAMEIIIKVLGRMDYLAQLEDLLKKMEIFKRAKC